MDVRLNFPTTIRPGDGACMKIVYRVGKPRNPWGKCDFRLYQVAPPATNQYLVYFNNNYKAGWTTYYLDVSDKFMINKAVSH